MDIELQYLRDEMNYRVQLVYSHSNSVLSIVATFFSVILAAITFSDSNSEYAALLPVLPIMFFIPLIIIHTQAQKFRENLDQIIEIAAYSAVFFDESIMEGKNIKNFSSWEFSTFEVGRIDKTEYSRCFGSTRRKMNKEYLWFAIICFIASLLLFVMSAKYLFNQNLVGAIVYVIGVLTLLTFSFRFVIVIYKCTSFSRFFDQKEACMNKWIAYALEKGYYNEETIREKFGDVFDDFLKEYKKK
ncbi:hypothetical protein AGMMS50212_15680 [Spirochaetia bacterium]|nr:hypothetical protein AGMMS50212_15680 [Spirochaetia bacterium]